MYIHTRMCIYIYIYTHYMHTYIHSESGSPDLQEQVVRGAAEDVLDVAGLQVVCYNIV